MKNIRVSIVVIVALVLCACISLIILKNNNQDIKKENNKTIENIEVALENDSIMINNVSIEVEQSKKYLVFDIVKLDSDLESIELNLQLFSNQKSVFQDEIIINDFTHKKTINQKIKLNNFNYTSDDLILNLSVTNNNKKSISGIVTDEENSFEETVLTG